jgi:hypothetical protein
VLLRPVCVEETRTLRKCSLVTLLVAEQSQVMRSMESLASNLSSSLRYESDGMVIMQCGEKT